MKVTKHSTVNHVNKLPKGEKKWEMRQRLGDKTACKSHQSFFSLLAVFVLFAVFGVGLPRHRGDEAPADVLLQLCGSHKCRQRVGPAQRTGVGHETARNGGCARQDERTNLGLAPLHPSRSQSTTECPGTLCGWLSSSLPGRKSSGVGVTCTAGPRHGNTPKPRRPTFPRRHGQKLLDVLHGHSNFRGCWRRH